MRNLPVWFSCAPFSPLWNDRKRISLSIARCTRLISALELCWMVADTYRPPRNNLSIGGIEQTSIQRQPVPIVRNIFCLRMIIYSNRILTEISWYEWFIMAISRFSKTTMLMTEYVPNISMPQKRVNIFMPSSSKLSRSTRPNTAQNSVCVVSNKLHRP